MRRYIPAAILIVAVILIITGVLAGQHTDVLNKAAKVCMECVGIG